MEVAYDNMLHFLELNFNNGANRAIYFDLIHIGAFVRAVRYDWITSKGDFLRYHGRINNPNSFSKLKGMWEQKKERESDTLTYTALENLILLGINHTYYYILLYAYDAVLLMLSTAKFFL